MGLGPFGQLRFQNTDFCDSFVKHECLFFTDLQASLCLSTIQPS